MNQALYRLSLVFALALAAACYLPGLSGPLLLDDEANLGPVGQWLNGGLGLMQVITGNDSGPLGRPIAMTSFVATAAAFGDSVIAFKATNLALHLIVGILVYLLIRALARRTPALPARPEVFALGIASVWLLHPILVGTVLYVVQRMAILSALFTLCAMLAYVHGRQRLEAGASRSAIAWLFVGVPVFTTLAAFSKENGLLAPLLCGVIEWAYFRPDPTGRRPKPVRAFIALFIGIPLAAALTLLLVQPGFYFDGYANRPFTPIERLLTQGRVLFDYVGSFLLPAGPDFSLYRDSYPLSTGLSKPWTTALAWLGWSAVLVAAVRLRRVLPSFSAGIGIFLVGHAMESSIFPLLIYFEHRNYLPAIGLLLAVGTLLVWCFGLIRTQLTRPNLLASAAFAGLIVVLAGAVSARSLVWQDKETLVRQSLEAYPDSRFARMELANIAMNRPIPDATLARGQYANLLTQDRPSTRLIGRMGLIAVDCFQDGRTEPDAIYEAVSNTPESIEADVIKAVRTLGSMVQASPCEGLSPVQYADALTQLADRVETNRPGLPTWRIRFRAARLYLAGNQTRAALTQARAAWRLKPEEAPIGMLVAQLNAKLGNRQAALRILDVVAPKISDTDRTGQSLLRELRQSLEQRAPPDQ